MPFVIHSYGGGQPFRNASHVAGVYIAASESVKQGLISAYGVPTEDISVIHAFIEPRGSEDLKIMASRELIRTELALPVDAFVAGMCGTIDWRKGADLFIHLAKLLATEFSDREIYLLWIGAPESKATQDQIDHDLRLAGLVERVRFIGAKLDSQRYLAALDVFTLLSREDPFPLAMLEAAALAIPSICFNRSGGGPEFVEADAGLVVGYADTLAVARGLVLLREQPALRRRLGVAARQKVMDRYTVQLQAPKILGIIERLARNS